MRYDLVEKVLSDLKGVIPYKEDIVWEDYKSIRTLGLYCIKENKIKINTYLDDDWEILNVMAHELIHSCGIHGHRKEFKEYMDKINSLGLGYAVHTHYKTTDENKDNTYHKIQKETRDKRKPSKKYIVWCKCCGWNRIYTRKHSKISNYRCPKCHGKLGQKQYKSGVTIQWGRCA